MKLFRTPALHISPPILQLNVCVLRFTIMSKKAVMTNEGERFLVSMSDPRYGQQGETEVQEII